ncbi:hypothetical protein GCM10007047_22630 [Cerasicoccus arenae]|uniref:O-antigen ligase-related domain-containing protein n=2 Tax=Cerasicoccus arenae TaxID=424488 RepID=A0A8J3GEP9_9BACT|nr:hypothetical protein GCM10007047_22630 [Cerasicoccus arenae]
MVISVALLGVALMFHTLCLLADNSRDPFTLNPLGLAFFPVLLYVALNLYLVSSYGWRGQEELLGLLQGIGLFWLTVQNFRTRNHIWFMMLVLAGVACVAVLLGIMQFFHRPEWLPQIFDPLESQMYHVWLPTQYLGRATGSFGAPTSYAGFLLLMVFPFLVAGFSRRFSPMARAFFVYAGLMLVGAIFLSMTRGALILLAIGLFLLPFVVRAKFKTIVIGWLLSALLLGAAFFLFLNVNESFRERINTAIEIGGESSRPVMWHAAWKQFLDEPVLGNGVGAYDFLFEGQRPEGFNLSPGHVHNDYLETLADQGLIGLVLFWAPVALILYLAFREWLRQPDTVRISSMRDNGGNLRMPTPKFLISAVGLGLIMFCGHLFLEFHLRTPALLLLFFLFLGLLAKCVPIKRVQIKRTVPLRMGILVCGFSLAMLIPLWAIPQYAALIYVQNGRRMMTDFTQNLEELKRDEAYFDIMIGTLREGVQRAPKNAEAWSDLSNAIAAQDYLRPGRGGEFGREAEGFARKSLQLNANQPQAWINLGNALSLQGRMIEAGEAYRKATEIAPNRSDVWYFYAAHLNLLISTRPQALEAVEHSLRLQPGREDSINLRRKILVP